ncbi:MAG: MBL fold metallo-hydrolase [Candidatus Pacebacteria bacterium]|nr:MBL fold metallo-hydrolase [Candidatus Paceibacterota bacterium]
MIITHYGKQFFKIQLGDTTLAFNPISKDSKLKEKPARFGADVVFITTNHPDYNGIETVTYGDKEPFIIDGPGSYEVNGTYIKALQSETEIDGTPYINTIYNLEFDGMSILFLGHLVSKEIPSAVREEIEKADIVFVPIGGKNTLVPLVAHKLAIGFEPSIIIPMDYGNDQEKDALQQFMKEGGDDSQNVDKLTVKQKDLETYKGGIVAISS